MVKISELPELVDPSGSEPIVVLSDGISKRVRADRLASAAIAPVTEQLETRVSVIDALTAYDVTPLGDYPTTPGALNFLNNSSAVIFSANEQVRLGGVGVEITSLGDTTPEGPGGSAALAIAEGDLSADPPVLTLIRAIELPLVTSTGPHVYTHAASGERLNNILTPGQHYIFSSPEGGVGISTNLAAGAECWFTYPGPLSEGSAVFTRSSGQRFNAYVEHLDARAEVGEDVLSESLKHRVGLLSTTAAPTVWDLKLIIGQSLAQGYNQPPLSNQIVVPPGWMKQWYLGALSDIVGDPVGNSTGASPWPSHALTYVPRTGHGVLYVPAARGGSSLVPASDPGNVFGNWSPTGAWLADALAKLDAAKAAATAAGLAWRMSSVLMDLGQTDALAIDNGLITIDQYEAALPVLLAALQDGTGMGEQMPLIMARIGHRVGGDSPGHAAIRGAQERFKRANPGVSLVGHGIINFAARGLLADAVHPVVDGWNEIGPDYAVVDAVRSAGLC